jgi:hypothetical protein
MSIRIETSIVFLVGKYAHCKRRGMLLLGDTCEDTLVAPRVRRLIKLFFDSLWLASAPTPRSSHPPKLSYKRLLSEDMASQQQIH